jgi:iron complex outermembrane receptor protein
MGVYVPITAAQSLQAFNLANGETLSRSLRRASAFASINHAIRGDSLAAFGSVLLSSVRTQSQLNAVPLVPYVSSPYSDLIEAGSTPPPPGTTYVLSSAPTNPFSGAFINGNQDFASGALVLARNRFTDFPRVFRDDDTLLRVVGGLRGRVCDRLNWEAAANFSRYRIAHSNGGLIDTANLVAAMNAGSVNPFAIRQPPGALPGDVIGSAYFNGSSTLEGFDARIFGDLVDLAGGAVGYSLGASWQVETLRAGVDSRSLPDPLTGAAAGWSGAPSLQPFSSRRDVASVCAEVSGPVVGPGQGVPWVREVNLDVAARLDDTPGVGTSLSPKAVLSYEPVGDTFRLRFSAGGAFVAPTLFDRFGPDRIGSTSPITFNDYGGGQTRQVQFNSVAQSSRSLAASTASTWTAGFDWTPGEFRGFSVSADYHQVVQKKIAGGIDPAVIAQGVESDGAGSTYARYVHFGSPGGPGVTGPGQLSTAVDSSVYVDTPLINEAARASTGIDGTIAYAWGTEGAPRFEVASTVSVISSYGVRALPSGDYLQYAGHASVDNGTLPRYRAYTALSWAYRGAEVAVAHTVIPPVTDIGQGGGDPVPVRGFQQFDISCSFRLGELHLSRRLEGLTVSAGVNNVFNREPPPARGAFPDTNVDVGTYNGPVGREVFASLDYRF